MAHKTFFERIFDKLISLNRSKQSVDIGSFLLVIAFLLVGNAFAQTASISGQAFVCKGSQYYHGSFSIYSQDITGERTIIKTDSTGHFSADNLTEGRYYFYYGGNEFNPGNVYLRNDQHLHLDTLMISAEWSDIITLPANYLTDTATPLMPIPNTYAQVYANMAQSITNLSWKDIGDTARVIDLMSMMEALPLLKVPEGWVVDGCRYGCEEGWQTLKYLRQKDGYKDVNLNEECWRLDSVTTSSGRTYFTKKPSFDSNRVFLTNERLVGYYSNAMGHVENALAQMEVPFTTDGIWQAFLFHHSTQILPLFWHSNYINGVPIFSEDAGYVLFPAEQFCLYENLQQLHQRWQDSVKVETKVEKTDDSTAIVTSTWWYDFGGLYLERWKAIRQGKSIRFDRIESTTLLQWEPSVMF